MSKKIRKRKIYFSGDLKSKEKVEINYPHAEKIINYDLDFLNIKEINFNEIENEEDKNRIENLSLILEMKKEKNMQVFFRYKKYLPILKEEKLVINRNSEFNFNTVYDDIEYYKPFILIIDIENNKFYIGIKISKKSLKSNDNNYYFIDVLKNDLFYELKHKINRYSIIERL